MSTADVPLQASVPLVPLEVPTADRRQSSAFADGSFETLGGILLRGFGLTIVTLGIYRFWMKTNIRRWYWSNTIIGGDALEYRGTGRELFIGFLIAVGILLPIYAVVVGGTYLSGILSWQAASQTFFVVFLVLAQYAVYRARRYRLTRTAWRGLTFSQTGSGWTYAGLWLASVAVSIASLGFAVPWVRALLEAYKIRHTRFGTAEGAFKPVLARPLILWGVLWTPVLAVVGLTVWNVYASGGLDFLIRAGLLLTGLDEAPAPRLPRSLLEAAGDLRTAVGLGVLWGLLLWPAYRTAEFRAFMAATRIGPVSFRSGVRAVWYYGAFLRFAGLFVLLSLVVAGFGFLILQGLLIGAATTQSSGLLTFVFVLSFTLYLASLIVVVILREIIITQGFWRHALSTLEITGLNEVDGIIASGQVDRAVGEGLADAFELGGF